MGFTDVTVTATTVKGTWAFVRVDLSTLEVIEGKYAKSIYLEVVGPADHSMIVKYNNSKESKGRCLYATPYAKIF